MKTTTTKIYLLPAITATRAHRMEQAHNRHSISTNGTWTADEAGNITPPIHRQSGEQLYQTADKAVFFALRAREEKSGVDLFRQLAQSAPADRTRRQLTRIGQEAMEAEQEHDRQRAIVEAMTAIYRSTKATPAERVNAWEQAEEAKAKAESARKRAEALQAVISNGTASEREQLVQVAVMAGLDPICAENPAEAFRHMTNSAGRAIATLSAPDALRSTTTKLHPITAEEAQRERSAHPDVESIDPNTGDEVSTPAKVAFNVRSGITAGYYTIEYREQTKRRPAGWYRVSHYHTTAPYVSYETFATGEGAEAIAKNDGINAITTQSAREEIEALILRANLTERERMVVLKLTDNTARKHAEQAHHKATAEAVKRIAQADPKNRKRTERRAKAEAEEAYSKTLWESAFTRAGIYAKTTRREMQARIVDRLEQARTAPEEQTPAEAKEAEARRWKSMQANRRRGGASTAPARFDALAMWQAVADKTTAPRPVVRWTESGHAPQTMTAEEVRAEAEARRAEQAERMTAHAEDIAIMEYRRAFTQDRTNRPAFPALDAQDIARRFFDRMTREEQAELVRAERAREAEQAHRRAVARATGIYGLNTTFEMWKNWSEEERAEHRRFLDSLK